MAKQALLRSKRWWVAGLLLTVGSCQQQDQDQDQDQEATAIPDVFVSVDQPGWQRRDGLLWLNARPFSGWQYQCRTTGDTVFMGAYQTGKAEGEHRHWYASHRFREVRHYRRGWQEGEQRGWYESGQPAFVYHFRNDVYEGQRKEWYPDGRVARDGHYQDGQEAGSQRMWFADGSLQANYVVRQGRTYGFTGVKNCVNVGDSIAVTR